MNLNCSPMPWLILISLHPVNKKHGTNLWTRFLHEAFFHKVPGQFGHQLEGRTKNKKTSMKVWISHVIFDAGERLHCASPLRRSLRGRPPGGSGTWPPWWRWTSRPSPGNNSQDAASVPLMSGWKARCHTPSIHSVCCWFLGESQVAFFFWHYLRLHTVMCGPDAAVLSISPSDSDAERTQWTRSGSSTNRPAEGALAAGVEGVGGSILLPEW